MSSQPAVAAAHSCVSNDDSFRCAMPLIVSSHTDSSVNVHRPKDALPLISRACAARPVSNQERQATPEALAAMDKERNRLRSVKHVRGVEVWNEDAVEEKLLLLLVPI